MQKGAQKHKLLTNASYSAKIKVGKLPKIDFKETGDGSVSPN